MVHYLINFISLNNIRTMQYIEREIDKDLIDWKNQPSRKPLLIRGARQVGKSSAVRNLGKTFKYYIEVDFISNKAIHRLFEGDIAPAIIYEELAMIFNTPIIANRTLVFFDEIQACPAAITSLRYFYEKLNSSYCGRITPEIRIKGFIFFWSWQNQVSLSLSLFLQRISNRI